MRHKRIKSTAAVVVLLALFATACGSSGEQEPAQSSQDVSGTPEDTSTSGPAETGEYATDSFVVASWGGDFAETTWNVFVEPFTAERGLTGQMVSAPVEQYAQLKAQLDVGTVTWDLIDSQDTPTVQRMIAEDMLEKLPEDVKSYLEERSAPGMVSDYGIMQTSIANPIICNPDIVEKCPTNPSEYFDVKGFPGDRMLYDDAPFGIYMALASLGPVPEEPTESDVDAAFEKLEQLMPSVTVVYTSQDSAMKAMQNEDAAMGTIGNGRIPLLMDDGMTQLKWSWEDSIYVLSWNVIPKGAPNFAASIDYLKYYADNPEKQAEFATIRGNGVASPEALDFMTEDVRNWLPESHPDDLVLINNEWWQQNEAKYAPRWRQLLGSA